ncbi:MAG: hypothetical protein LBB63_00595 [Holosporaceae bacterium]|jgi:hypothetical protein|nr:hypothetical protein [Holosporaceae bacterium]
MKLIFDWSDSFYEEKTVWRSDVEMIALEISQKESGFASARVLLASGNAEELLSKKYAKIGVQSAPNSAVRLLFAGRLVAFPLSLGNSSVELELIAEPDDHRQQLREFSRENAIEYQKIDKHAPEQQKIIFDELFFSERDMDNPTIFLEGGDSLFYWDMRSGKLSLSGINRGAENIDLDGGDILEDSMRVRIAREPYGRINLSLSVSWIQQVSGIIDLYPMMAQKFDQRLVNSFTDMKTGLEHIFKISHRNGYAPLRCGIRRINPNTAGILSAHPLISQDFHVQKDQSSPRIKVNFRRFYFDGELLLAWNYRQKRTEVARVKVMNGKRPDGREKNLFLRLNAVQTPRQYPVWNYFTYYGCGQKVLHRGSVFECMDGHVSGREFQEAKWKFLKKIPDALRDDASSSFFATNRGKNALRYALRKAAALANYSSRYVEMDFCVDANRFLWATVNDQVVIRDGRFPGGSMGGKIIGTKFTASADRKIMKITIGCRVDAAAEDYLEKVSAYNPDIREDDSRLNPGDIVTDVEVKNPPEEQAARLAQVQAKDVEELKGELRKLATKIKISLHPLNTARTITRELDLPDVTL